MEYVWNVVQIIFADIILSGDNALVIGMAAAGLPAEQRRKAIMLGMAMAAGLRIVFAVMATWLLQIPGILFFGGLLLAIVCWRFYKELRAHQAAETAEASDAPPRTLWQALVTITIADVSMSIDNVVAVAAIAREDTALLVFGLGLAIVFMALCATYIMRIMTRYPWLSWAGLVFLIYLTIDMILDGWPEVAALVGIA